eukprot:TRINITY_DN5292_c0_g2_i1.p1 TRINITY_DN5292_c0_g2~~TRINITY_DN5292_c0_g2_i1.p1  ORF type:complete len:270 (-),score=45.66 TRINITY_DN5292_c0_g2_i1:36-845(-)
METSKLSINTVRVSITMFKNRSRASDRLTKASWLKRTQTCAPQSMEASSSISLPITPYTFKNILRYSSNKCVDKLHHANTVQTTFKKICISKKVSRPHTPRSDTNSDASDLSSEGVLMLEGEDRVHYVLKEQIGKGAYSIVKMGIKKPDGTKMAIKIYEQFKLLDKHKKQSTKNEIAILKKLSHPSVVKFYESIETKENLYLIFELIPGTSLCSYVYSRRNKRLSEDEVKTIFIQIVSAVSYLHSKNVLHRDIKPVSYTHLTLPTICSV